MCKRKRKRRRWCTVVLLFSSASCLVLRKSKPHNRRLLLLFFITNHFIHHVFKCSLVQFESSLYLRSSRKQQRKAPGTGSFCRKACQGRILHKRNTRVLPPTGTMLTVEQLHSKFFRWEKGVRKGKL